MKNELHWLNDVSYYLLKKTNHYLFIFVFNLNVGKTRYESNNSNKKMLMVIAPIEFTFLKKPATTQRHIAIRILRFQIITIKACVWLSHTNFDHNLSNR